MIKIYFTVDKMGEDGSFGVTHNPDYVWGNLNKVPGSAQILTEDIKKYPPDSEIENCMILFNFIALVRLHTSNKDVTMFLFDAKNNEDKAIELCNTLSNKGADENTNKNLMDCFYKLRESYDEVSGVAELRYLNK